MQVQFYSSQVSSQVNDAHSLGSLLHARLDDLLQATRRRLRREVDVERRVRLRVEAIERGLDHLRLARADGAHSESSLPAAKIRVKNERVAGKVERARATAKERERERC